MREPLLRWLLIGIIVAVVAAGATVGGLMWLFPRHHDSVVSVTPPVDSAQTPSLAPGTSAMSPTDTKVTSETVAEAQPPAIASPRGRDYVILQIGDSHTAADLFTGQVRDRLQAKFGAGGLFLPPGIPRSGVQSSEINIKADDAWTYKAPFSEVVIPIAISFFTFHAISYMVDAHAGRMVPTRNLRDVMLYISFFPHLVAGPIVRAADFIPQIQAGPKQTARPYADAMALIVGGLFKKVVFANYLSVMIADPVFTAPGQFGGGDILLAVIAYAFQIYFDFSAYTDIAIGVAALLGYRFPENFNQPYRSLSPREFWTRWHISLSTWLRDYLYIPLGGSRHGMVRTIVNLMITMVLGGLWHGANITFVILGTLHGVALVANHLWAKTGLRNALKNAAVYKAA